MAKLHKAINSTDPAKPPSRRQEASEQRRQAILDAGLAVFAASGFAAARLDDVAERAGVAKGTIYLSFKDKEDLFEQIVLGAIAPVLARLDQMGSHPDLPLDMLLAGLFQVFEAEILGTERKQIIRLVISEGARFPRIAEFYHREVVGKGLALIRYIAERAHARGELDSNALAEFPQLVFAPLLLSVIWDGLFSRIEPLDVRRMLDVHRSLLLGPAHTRSQRP